MKHHYGTSDEDKSLWLTSKYNAVTLVLLSLSYVPFFILKPIKIMIKYYRKICDELSDKSKK